MCHMEVLKYICAPCANKEVSIWYCDICFFPFKRPSKTGVFRETMFTYGTSAGTPKSIDKLISHLARCPNWSGKTETETLELQCPGGLDFMGVLHDCHKFSRMMWIQGCRQYGKDNNYQRTVDDDILHTLEVFINENWMRERQAERAALEAQKTKKQRFKERAERVGWMFVDAVFKP